MTNEEIVEQIQNGIDVKANMELLYLNNRGMISNVAYKYSSKDDYEDLVQEGYIALDRAAKQYDTAGGFSFYSYAYKCVTHSIMNYKLANNTCMRIPYSSMYSKIIQLRKYVSHYRAEHGCDPAAVEVIEALDITPTQADEIRRVISIISSHISLDQPVTENSEDITVSDTIPDPENQVDELLDAIERQELKAVLWNIVDALSGMQPKVIRDRFKEGKTYRECAAGLHLSGERVRQIEKRGLKKLREVHSKELLPYYHDYVYQLGLKGTSFSEFRYTNESSVERAVMKLSKKQ